MKVKDLLKHIQGMDPNSEVIAYTEDQNLVGPGLNLRVLEIEEVRPLVAERTRLKDNVPYLKLGKSANSEQFVALCVTSDF